MDFYQKAANKGNEEAMFALGNMYKMGKGVEKNMNIAVDWFRKAAEKGHAAAQYQYGYCLYNGGGGVKVDKKEAVKWVQKAANQGDDDATMFMLLIGEGTPN